MGTWSWGWAFRNLVAELLMPPGIWLVIIALTFLFLKSKRAKSSLIAICLLMVWVSSTNYFANQITTMATSFLDWPDPLAVTQVRHKDHQMPQAIIILGGGRRVGALDAPPQYQRQDVSVASMERLRFGARLAKATRLPILVTGGAPDRVSEKDIPEAILMSHVLQDELGVGAKWVESNSNTTQENARESAQILKKERIKTFIW